MGLLGLNQTRSVNRLGRDFYVGEYGPCDEQRSYMLSWTRSSQQAISKWTSNNGSSADPIIFVSLASSSSVSKQQDRWRVGLSPATTIGSRRSLTKATTWRDQGWRYTPAGLRQQQIPARLHVCKMTISIFFRSATSNLTLESYKLFLICLEVI